MIRSAFLSEVREGFEELAKCFPTPSGWQLIGSEALQASADGSQQFDLSWIPAWKLPKPIADRELPDRVINLQKSIPLESSSREYKLAKKITSCRDPEPPWEC